MIGQAERDILESVIEVTNQPVDKFRFKMDEVEGLRFVYVEKLLFFLSMKIQSESGISVKASWSSNLLFSSRYRASDALHACTKRAIRDCRVAEIKQAILNSKKLQVKKKIDI